MKIMAVNAGSSSLKFQLLEMPEETVITEGIVERIGLDDSYYTINYKGQKEKQTFACKDHTKAVEKVINDLVGKKILSSLDALEGVGHRIVQGADCFKGSVLITREVKETIRDLSDLAPLHNPAHIMGIEAFEKILPNIKQTVVFDTSFHQTMKEEVFMYSIPYEWYEKYRVRKYGAHGTSHKYVSEFLINKLKLKESKIVTLHLGNGASLAAIKNGVCVDTSMGLTPLEGIPMGTRSGIIDPTVVSFMGEKLKADAKTIVNDLNKKSGYLGVSGISHDSRDIEKAMREGNRRAKLALDIQIKRIVDYIGSYYFLLEGIDYLIFTAGIGENSEYIRTKILERLSFLGVVIDYDKIKVNREFLKITKENSKISAFVVPTNEELAIARDTYKLITNK